MSRRMDREGVPRHETQRLKNERTWSDPRCHEDERGWVQPFANWQGWEEYNRAVFALRRLMIFWNKPRLSSIGHVRESLQTFNWAIHFSKKCDRPRLPGGAES